MKSRTRASSKAASSSAATRWMIATSRRSANSWDRAADTNDRWFRLSTPCGLVRVCPLDRLDIVITLPVRVVEWFDGYEFDTELLTTLDKAEELSLVDHLAGQHRQSVLPLQRHPSEAPLELITEFSPEDDPIAATRCLLHGLETSLALGWVSPQHSGAVFTRVNDGAG